MLQEFLSALGGPAAISSYTNPASNGIKGVPAASTFKNFFNNLLSSFTPISSNNLQGFSQGQGQGQGYPRAPMQGIQNYGNNPFFANQVIQNQAIKKKAVAIGPGSVLLDSQMLGSQVSYPSYGQGYGQGQIPQGAYPQLAQLAGGGPLPGGLPIQGFTNQNGAFNGQAQGGFNTPFGAQGGFYPNSPYGSQGQGQGAFGKLQLLLMPVIGIFSLVKSLFGFRNLMGSLKPVQVDKQSLDIFEQQKVYDDYEKQEGSFDEFEPEIKNENFNLGNLQEF